MNHLTYLFLAIIAITIQSGGCNISCYNCLSKNSRACINPLASDEIKPQPCNMALINLLANQTKLIAQQLGNAFGIDVTPAKTEPNIAIQCQKIVITVGNERVIARGCQIPGASEKYFCDNMKAKATDQNTVITHCSLCDTDGCNAAHWLAPLSLLPLLLPALGVTIWTVYTA